MEDCKQRWKSVGGLWTARVNAIGSQITIRPQISCAEYIEENRKLVRSRIGERIDNQVQNPFFSFVISALIAIRYRRRQQQEEKETEQRDTVQRKRFTDLVAFFLPIAAANTLYWIQCSMDWCFSRKSHHCRYLICSFGSIFKYL